jgi:cell division protein FtsI/penicillin-binding protein 2
MLQQVVESGTGTGVQIEQYTVAGKTGTAQKALPGVGYASGRYIGSFIGFVPVENPAIVILVVIDEPRNGYYGGVCAGPAFKEIAQQSLVYLGVPPQTVARAH